MTIRSSIYLAHLPLLALLATGCGTAARVSDNADASVAPAAASPAAATQHANASALAGKPPLEQLRSLAPVAQHFDPSVHLARIGSGYAIDGYLPTGGKGRFSRLSAERMVASAPAHSNEPVHVGRVDGDGNESIAFEVIAEDLHAAAGRVPSIHAGTLAFAEVLPGQDLVHVLTTGRIEELRIVRTASDEIVTQHRIRGLRGVRGLQTHDAIVEVVGNDGKVAFQSEPIVAYDGAGQTVPTSISIHTVSDGWILETRVASRGRALPIVVDPTWTLTTPDLPGGHDPAWAYPYPGTVGKVLIMGGNRVDVFDPYAIASPWSTLSSSVTCGNGQGITQLNDGKFLFATTTAYGCLGSGTGDYLLSYLFDATTGVSTRVGDLAYNHASPKAALMSDGRVALMGQAVGGANPNGVIEVYTPGSKTWSIGTTLPLASGTGGYAFVALNPVSPAPIGKVLVAGGAPYSSNDGNATYLFDPNTNTYSTGPNLHTNRRSPSSAKLADGTVLVFGGNSSSNNGSTAEIYDPVANTWTPVASTMSYNRMNAGVLKMPDGKWFIIGGYGYVAGGPSSPVPLSTTEFYDPATKTFSAGPNMLGPHEDPAVSLLPGGRVLVAGGYGPYGLNEPAEVYTPDPTPATSGSSCASTFAADGYCCDRACTGTCEACNVAGHVGVCWPVTGAPPSGHGSCAPFLCAGLSTTTGTGVCEVTCGSDAGCSSGNYCDLSTSQCVPQKAQGSGCSRNGECGTGQCVDGVCCNSACTGTCQACDVVGSIGTCTSVPSGDPHGTRVGGCGVYACVTGACASGSCTADAQCASHRFCVGGSCNTAAGQGAACTRDAQCQSGHCVDGFCCDTACGSACMACDVPSNQGTCTAVASGPPHGARNCGGYASCTAGACATTCALDSDCTTGHGCSASTCVVRKANGAACSLGTECASGSCADGVCCDKACNGACQACNLTGTIGVCTAVDGFADPHALCASGPCATGICKAGACGFKSVGTACGTSSCTTGVLTASTCDGATAGCPAATTAPCAGSLICADALVCKSACVVDTDCTSGVCDPKGSGKCVAPVADAGPVDTGPADTGTPDTGTPDTGSPDTGAPDTGTPDTATPDTGTGDDSASSGDSLAIAEVGAPKIPATPTVTGFQRCHQDSECPSGHCVEGVCCDTACQEPCHSCALLSSPGKCTIEPTGVDLKNDCGPGLQCLGTCGPSGECIGSGAGTQCARNRCTGPSSGVGPAYCPGPGQKCDTNDQTPFECGAYACEPAFGACLVACTSTSECAPGNVCDTTAKTCGPSAAPSSSGGCAIGTAGASGTSSSAVLSAVGLGLSLVIARRRRSSRI